jgi:hypothetical protein
MRHAKYFDKDLYSKWHRLHDGIAMCDVDSVEICMNKGCWKPLAIIEHLYDLNQTKKKIHNHCRTYWESLKGACFFGLL